MRRLKPEEIDVKVKQITSKGALLLLYKTARVDMQILDEEFGPLNWQSDYKLINNVLFCGIGIKNGADWVWKWDCGIESRTDEVGNEKKGEASDAFKRAGHTYDNYYASEVDKYAIKTTLKNFPQTIQIGDIKSVWSRNLPPIDLIMGGSPCQDLSIAGKRAGLGGERSGLFWHFVRLVRTCKPKYFLLENVASMTKENRDIISEALGVEPILINSALVSAQQRKRLYWTNIPDITQPQDRGLLLKDILEDGMPYEEKACALTASYDGAVIWNSLAKKQRTMIAKPVCLGNLYGQNTRWGIFDKDGKSPTLTASMGLGGGHTPMVADTPQAPVKLGEFGRGGQGYRVYSVVGKSVALKKEASNGSISEFYKIDLPDGDYAFRKLSPIECERLQTLPDNYTEGISNTQRYKCIGNGWTVDVIAHIFSFMED